MTDTLRAVRWSDVQQHLNGANADVQKFYERLMVRKGKKLVPGPRLLEAALQAANTLTSAPITSAGLGDGGGTRCDEDGFPMPKDAVGDAAVAGAARPSDADQLVSGLRDAVGHGLEMLHCMGLTRHTDVDDHPIEHIRFIASCTYIGATLGEACWKGPDMWGGDQSRCLRHAMALAAAVLQAKAAAWRLTATPHPDDAPADKHGCRSCERIRDSRGRAMWSEPRVDGGTLCRWCEDQNTARGAWPPEAVLRLHHDGKRITDAHYEAAAKATKQAKKKAKR